jgi:integrase
MAGTREKHYRVINGQIYARFIFTDGEGKKREKHIQAESKTDARRLYQQLKRDFEDHGEQSVDARRMRFRQLADIYEKARLQPAEYKGERKVAGRRSYKSPQTHLRMLIAEFGAKHIRSITHTDIERFKLKRLKTVTVRGKERSIASVNRELEVMRAAMRFAARSGWIIKSPFDLGDGLISKADEVQRDRPLERDEEERLLAACTGRRAHLRPFIIAALDTAMRRGELIQLRWSDIDLANREINIRSMTTKTARSRTVPISVRLLQELTRLQSQAAGRDDNALVFGITDNVKNGFAAVCRAAGVSGFRLHDCRHTAITRMIQGGMAPLQVMKISGHTQMSTFARYVSADDDAVRRAAEAIDIFNAAGAQVPTAYTN